MSAPRIVVLDGFTVNPGDLDWQPLAVLGQLTVHQRSHPTEVVERMRDAPIVLTNKVSLSAAVLSASPALHCVAILATGTNAVDLPAARAAGITVCNVPAYGTESVVQLVFENLLDAATQAQTHRAAVRAGGWEKSPDFCFNVAPLQELQGKRLGIVGFGTIGSRVAQVAQAFGMRVLIAESHAPHPRALPDGSTRIPLRELLREADFVTLHCPLSNRTRGLIGASELALMKPSAYLINTARGALIDEGALAAALDAGQLAGAYLDVLDGEPPNASNPLLYHARCKVTPHMAWTTREARQRLIQISADNVAGFLRGAPQNVVS